MADVKDEVGYLKEQEASMAKVILTVIRLPLF